MFKKAPLDPTDPESLMYAAYLFSVVLGGGPSR